MIENKDCLDYLKTLDDNSVDLVLTDPPYFIGFDGGKYPETIACVLWGTDNIKTYGESLAQILWMVGVRPVPDALGRVNKLELIPLEELGRPRIDVVVNCSGVFRDLFINQMNLLDQGVKMAAEANEPMEMN